MPRSDYEKFIEIANNELNSKHECQTYKTHKNFTSPHILIVLKNSSIIFNSDLINKTKFRSGIYIDILPLDQVSTNKQDREKHARILRFIKKIKYYKSSRISKENNKIEIILKWIIRNILSIISWQTINHYQQKVAMMYNNLPDTGEICSTLSHYKYEKLYYPTPILPYYIISPMTKNVRFLYIKNATGMSFLSNKKTNFC